MDIKTIKELYFNILDVNKDRKICETDLFNVLKSIESFEVSNILIDDIVRIFKFFEDQRMQQGKHDDLAMLNDAVKRNSITALTQKKTVGRSDYIEEVKEFLREVKEHQEREKRKTELENVG